MASAFWTDDERRSRLDEAFEMGDGADLHPNIAEFYARHIATLDAERAEHLANLVSRAKSRYAQGGH